jgi:plasmid stabilization system protein ParE
MKLVISKAAGEDFKEIISRIMADEHPQAAAEFAREVRNALRNIKDNPFMMRVGIRKDTRDFPVFKKYLVMYKITSSTQVSILRIVHGARNLKNVNLLHSN